MKFRFLTLFPALFETVLAEGIIGRAVKNGLLEASVTDLRPYGEGKHKTIDDTPYGGGAGMVMKVAPLVRAIEEAREKDPRTRVVMLTPQGRKFDQSAAREYAALPSLTLLCGRYEGFDERVNAFVDEELSLGDFVMMGGEAAALAVFESVARLLPGVLGDPESIESESHAEGLLEYPQYTRPRVFRGMEVPAVLLGGNHAEIERWRRAAAEKKTAERRPDLLAGKQEPKESLGGRGEGS